MGSKHPYYLDAAELSQLRNAGERHRRTAQQRSIRLVACADDERFVATERLCAAVGSVPGVSLVMLAPERSHDWLTALSAQHGIQDRSSLTLFERCSMVSIGAAAAGSQAGRDNQLSDWHREIALADLFVQTSGSADETEQAAVCMATALGTPTVFCDDALHAQLNIAPSWRARATDSAALTAVLADAVVECQLATSPLRVPQIIAQDALQGFCDQC